MFKKTSMQIILFLLAINLYLMVNAQSRCKNPNNRNGYCITMLDCPTLLEVVQKQPLTESDRSFLLQSQCVYGYGKPPFVCCTEDKGYTNGFGTMTTSTTKRPLERPNYPSNGRGNILPNPPVCGVEPTNNKIYNGNATLLDEFPWMVLLEYRASNGRTELNCGGSLINQRYVLTAAHCVVGAIEKAVGTLFRIRLGEYDTSKDIDCIDTDCADPIVEVGIEEKIPHEDYNDRDSNRYNDIALIRLDRDVTYSDFIKPVCLPSTLNLRKSTPGTNLIIAGWGRTLLTKKSTTKQKLSIPIFDQNECSQKFSTKGITISDSQICAGGQYAYDSCDGDSGGPLMKFTNKFWAIEGIISFGNRCGLEGWPGIYTRVTDYEDWIKRTIRP